MSRTKLKADLAWQHVKTLNVGELLKRIKALAAQLAALEQDNVVMDEIRPLASQFASGELLLHKNKGVTAYAACCIADLLRLSAPDAPFSQTQLKPVFECFIKQLRQLQDPEGAYYAQHYYLLESLAMVESVVLVCDIPDKSEALIADIFKALFDACRGAQRKNTESLMVSIMSQLINEAAVVPEPVIDLLLAQFRSVSASNKDDFSNARTVRDMAATILNNCSDRLQRNVCQHFTDVVCKATAHGNDTASEEQISDLRAIHDLVLQLFEFAPMTLQNVVPQLESELNVEDTDCRILATATISAMLASLNGGLILSHYSSAYKSWTSRRNDKSAQVRTTWIQGVGQILHSSSGAARLPEVEKICIDGLMTKFIDPDEKVRTAACFVVGQMPYAVAKECLTSAVLSQFAIRCRDKKHATQSIAFSTISRFLQAALPDIVAGNKHVRDKFGPLVNDMLHCMYINDPEVSAMLEEGLLDHVLNVGLDDGFAKAPQLLELVNLADEKARKALFVILGPKQMRNSQLLAKYLQVCDKFNGGIMDRNEDQITKVQTQIHRALAAQCPDTQTAVQDLLKFAMLNDRKLYKLMQSCLNIDSDDRLIRKAYGEFKSRMLKTPGHTATTMCMILRRSAFLILNRSLMPGIYAAAANPVSVYAAPARELLKVITSSHSSIYRAYLEPIIKDIKESGLVIAVDNLKAFAIFARSNTDIMPDDADFEESLQCIALKGSPVQVKQAVTILCSMKSRDTMAEALCTRIMAGLAYGEDHLLGHLAALAQLSLLAAQAIERWANDISAFCLKELLLKSRTGVDNAHADLEWVADNTLEDECRAKCLAIKILGNRLRAFHAAETATEIARPVFRALQSIIDNVGEVSLESNTPLHHRSRIRLEASRIMIKLAQFPIYERLISARDFNSFALFAQDLEYHVRTRFLTQLQKSLVSGKLPARFNVILFLAAHDPDKHLQDETLKWAKNLAISHRSQGYMMEAMLPRLVHLLAHHPDFAVDDRDDNDLLNFAVYFSFYFDAVVTEESLTLVYHYAQRLKQVADAVNHDSDNIYVLSDIAQAVFAAKAEHNCWPLNAYPKKLKLPTDLFCPLNSTTQAAHTQTSSYISGELRDAIRIKVSKSSRSRAVKTDAFEAVAIEKPVASSKQLKRSKNASAKVNKKRRSLTAAVESTTRRRFSDRQKTEVTYEEQQDEDSDEQDQSSYSS